MFSRAATLLTCLAALPPKNALAIGPPGNTSWIEIATGPEYPKFDSLSAASPNDPKVVSTRLPNKHVCGVSVENPGYTAYLPMVNTTVGDVPCKKGTFMAADAPVMGPFIVRFQRGEGCTGVGKSCEPLLTVDGQNFPMWEEGKNCHHATVQGDDQGKDPYDVYRCGFNGRP